MFSEVRLRRERIILSQGQTFPYVLPALSFHARAHGATSSRSTMISTRSDQIFSCLLEVKIKVNSEVQTLCSVFPSSAHVSSFSALSLCGFRNSSTFSLRSFFFSLITPSSCDARMTREYHTYIVIMQQGWTDESEGTEKGRKRMTG